MRRKRGVRSDDPKQAGASLRRTAGSQIAKRDEQIAAEHGTGIKGKHHKRFAEEPAQAKAFRTGAEGERAVARTLNKKVKGKHVLPHNQTHPNRRGDIDHIAITPAGVWVVDSKKYAGTAGSYDSASDAEYGWCRL